MNWFKSFRTMTKLMMGFGFVALLLGLVGYLGLNGMGRIEERMASLYHEDMRGLGAIKDVATFVAMAGRQTRGAVLATDVVVMEREREKIQALFGQVDQAMLQAEQTFHTEKGKAMIAQLKQVLPEYRSICTETVRMAISKNR